MIIQHNISAQNSRRKLNENIGDATKSLSRLSSGFRINSAADDAASLAISEKMRHQITCLETGTNNIAQGKAFSQIGDGALEEVQAMLRRSYELAAQSSNGTYTEEERPILQQELSHILQEIDRIAKYTQVNGHFPLNFDTTRTQIVPPAPSLPSDNIYIDFDKIQLGASLNSDAALSSSGSVNLGAVTNDTYTDAKQMWNLVYGKGSTSHTQLRLYVGNPPAAPINLDLNQDQLQLENSYSTVTDPVTGAQTFSLTYKYTRQLSTNMVPAPDTASPDDCIDIEVTENITINPRACLKNAF